MLKLETRLQKYLMLVLLLCGSAFSAHAQGSDSDPSLTAPKLSDDPRNGEIWKKSQVLRDHPSTDSTVISFSIAGVNYKVPRSYITQMDSWNGGAQGGVSFHATFPGFEPLTEKTKQCLTEPRAYWPAGCIPIEFWIHGKNGPSDDDHFNNQRDLFHSQLPKQGPAGFEMYETGPLNARIETYRKKTSTHTLLIDCISNKLETDRKPVCENYGSPLPSGNGLSYRLDFNQLENAEKIDNGIRSLVNSFTVKEE